MQDVVAVHGEFNAFSLYFHVFHCALQSLVLGSLKYLE